MVSIANQAPPNCPLATPGKFPSPGADCRGSFYARRLDKQYQAPAVLPIKAGVWHTFQPLEDDTLIYCIHRRERDFGEARPYRRRPSVSPRAMSTMDIALAGLFGCTRDHHATYICGLLSYATAMHEIGHILGRYQNSRRVMVRESWAWVWARRNALMWTPATQSCLDCV